MSGWHNTSPDDLPDEGRLVEVPNNGGAHLRRKGNMWFLPDWSMYVYYRPAYWRYADNASGT